MIVQSKDIPDIVNGGIDGTIASLGIVAGVAGAGLSATVVLLLGFAKTLSDAFSMAAARYLSVKAQRDLELMTDPTRELKGNVETPVRAAVVVFVTFVILASLPLMGFVYDAVVGVTVAGMPFLFAYAISAVSLVSIGIGRGMAYGDPVREGIRTTLIGGTAALIAYFTASFAKGIM